MYFEAHVQKDLSLVAKVFIVCAPLLFCGLVQAQFDNGSLVGTIRDASGAPVPHAKVTITNTETGIATQASTNGTGEYNVPSLRVGTYKIVASSDGFSDAEADNISVSVGVSQHIDLSLKVGAAATTVEVSGVALQPETETSERGQTVTNYESRGVAVGQPQLLRPTGTGAGLAPGARRDLYHRQQLAGARRLVQRQRPTFGIQQLSARRRR
jgi:hypothetical protein